jgi:hypothetical protein
MFRTARRIAPLLSSLLLGCAAASGAVLTTGVIAGCGDENDPATHVKKLDDPATRAQAVSRLIQFYEDKMTQDKGDRKGPQVKPLLELIVKPMTERCAAGDLDDRTNSKLIKFLADTRDPLAEPCLIKTLKDYKPDNTEEDVRSAARAVAALKMKSAAGPLMDVFTKIHASKPKAQSTYRDVHDAMVALQDPSWETQLINYLKRPLDTKDQNIINDEMFWQITSAELLGHMKSANAVKPLIQMLLSPIKAAGQLDAILALVKIGKPAIAATVALLRGEDKELVDYSKGEVLKAAQGDKNAEKGAATAYVATAALILATIGREETAQPLIEALAKAEDNVAKAVMARELTKVPKSAQTIKAFQDTVDKLPIALSIPNSRGGAREVLLDKAADFYDAGFVPWMLKSVKDMKGEEGDLAPIREAALGGMMKIMKQDQISLVEAFANQKTTEDGKPSTVGKGFVKELTAAKTLLEACGDKVDCYLGKLTDPAMQTDDKQFQGIKSAYMLGVLGDASAKAKIVAALPKISHPAIRFATVSVLDALSPKGDAAVAGQLQAIVDDAVEKKNQEKMRLNSPLKQVIYRLNARAQ